MKRLGGSGWLVLLGGGEFSFGETEAADRAWLTKAGPGPIGFLPAASGSLDYGQHFATYLKTILGREAETIPIYRRRDALRGKNSERIGQTVAVYIGGGVTDQLLDTVKGSPAEEALAARLTSGGVVVAIAAAAQALGRSARSLLKPGALIDGLALLPEAVLEPNFDPDHDRRLRQLMAAPGVKMGIGLPAGSALMLGPEGQVETLGTVYALTSQDGEITVLGKN